MQTNQNLNTSSTSNIITDRIKIQSVQQVDLKIVYFSESHAAT